MTHQDARGWGQRLWVMAGVVALGLLAGGLALSASLAGTGGATIQVTTVEDERNVDGDCSLREALIAANSDSAVDGCTAGSGADTILLPAGIYTLVRTGAGEDGAETGDLDLTADVTIQGAGTAQTVIDANELDRVVHVLAPARVSLSDLTLRRGAGTVGAGLFNESGAVAFLVRVTLSDNRAGEFNLGGGVNNQGVLTLTQSSLVDNVAFIFGGGLHNGGSAWVLSSTLSGNVVFGDEESGGGGASTVSGSLHLLNSTVHGNQVRIALFPQLSYGAGVYNFSGATEITNSTVSDNGGEMVEGAVAQRAGTLTMRNTLVAHHEGIRNCRGAVTSLGHNLEDADDCGLSAPGDITGTLPLLGPLQENGGPTLTRALLPGSPAIEAGAHAGCPPADQRGVLRPQDGDGDGTAACDIGAFEVAAAPPPTFTHTPTRTHTPSATPTVTPTIPATPTGTPSPSLTASPTPSATGTATSPPTATMGPRESHLYLPLAAR